MPDQLSRKWAAVQQDRVLLTRETKEEAEAAAEECPTDQYEIVALPKNGGPGPIL